MADLSFHIQKVEVELFVTQEVVHEQHETTITTTADLRALKSGEMF